MKNFFLFTLVLLLLSIYLQPASAGEKSHISSVKYDSFGIRTYKVTTINTLHNSSDSSLLSSTKTVTKSKKTTYYNSRGAALWYVKVTGTFTYGNGSARCTSSSVSVASYTSAWKVYRKSGSKSGNTATGKATARLYLDKYCIKAVTKSITLKCSPTGVFS